MKSKALVAYFSLFFQICFSQPDSLPPILIHWEEVIPGLSYCETSAPIQALVNDSKLSFVKIKPSYFEFELLMGSEHGRKSYTVEHWADSFQMNVVINAGMYDLAKKLHSKAFLKNRKHTNNSQLYPNYNSMIAFQPKDTSSGQFTIFDLKCDSWEKIRNRYHCFAQGLRMIDCNGEALGWNKKKQACSMLLAAKDEEDNIYFVFCRSPYTHNEMIRFLRSLPFKVSNAIYLEGGPQTSLYIDVTKENGENFCVEKVGSYVSETYETDLNMQFWTLPNVIGLKAKKINQ